MALKRAVGFFCLCSSVCVYLFALGDGGCWPRIPLPRPLGGGGPRLRIPLPRPLGGWR